MPPDAAFMANSRSAELSAAEAERVLKPIAPAAMQAGRNLCIRQRSEIASSQRGPLRTVPTVLPDTIPITRLDAPGQRSPASDRAEGRLVVCFGCVPISDMIQIERRALLPMLRMSP